MKIILCFFTLFFISFNSFSQLVINEIDADNPGADTQEFIELKSNIPNFSLNGYIIVLFNENTVSSYLTINLNGYTTDANGIIHFGNSGVIPAPTFVLGSNFFQNGPDVIAIYQASINEFPNGSLPTTLNLIDAVAYSNSNSVASDLMSALNITVSTPDIETTSSVSKSIQRKNDGTYEVNIPTPGMPNDGSGVVFNYINVSTSQLSYNEGDIFSFNFTTSQPVENETLIFNFTIQNGSFTMDDYSGELNVSIPIGESSGSVGIILFNDGLDEGDEEMKFTFQSLPMGYLPNNDNIIYRVYDVNFATDPWGTPLNPTYNMVTPTIPLGYYDSLEGLSGDALKQELQNIIANPAVIRLHSYADIWEILRSSDRNPLNNNQVWCMYVEAPMAKLDQQNTSSIVGKWNREHIFCQSRGGFEVAQGDTADGINIWSSTGPTTTVDGVSDAHHIRAENGQENSSRNNKNYGEINSATVYAGPTGNQGSWKGDVARALFYMVVRFDGLNVVNGDPSEYLPSTTIASGNIGDLATLLNWHTTDPSDDFEMNRNNYIYTWQMNRNPFIDHPSLVDYIFGANYGQPWSAALSNQIPIENKVAVYPNPATEYIIISGLEGASKVEVYTVSGQLVLENEFYNDIRINLDLKSGMYLVKVSNGVQSTTKKIIVK